MNHQPYTLTYQGVLGNLLRCSVHCFMVWVQLVAHATTFNLHHVALAAYAFDILYPTAAELKIHDPNKMCSREKA